MKPKRPRMRFPAPVAELIKDGLADFGAGERLRDVEIWMVWADVVGSALASQAQPLRFINGVLTVAVSSGPWLQELSFLKELMREKLNGRLGRESVKEIVLRSGRVTREAQAAPERPLTKKALTQTQMDFIQQQASLISDSETREAFAALMKASFENRPQNQEGRRRR